MTAKISFASDYVTGAHPQILQRLLETNLEPLPGYGADKYSAAAAAKIRAACGSDALNVFFLMGGTQANAVIISTLLAPYQGVVAADSGHINVHEAGAVEYTGHKVLPLPQREGKIEAAALARYLADFYADANHEHMVFPGLVYISHPTEYGTLYSKAELAALSEVCRRYKIPLFLDGARLIYGLASRSADVGLPDNAALCDVFYIGGTKAGALCGEAVVMRPEVTPPGFVTLTKQRGAMLAKGRLLGVQFDALFSDGLYQEIGRHAIAMAELLRQTLREAGCRFLLESPTNQQFIVMPNDKLAELQRHVDVSFWEKVDDAHTAIRLATCWSTRAEDIAALRQYL